MYFESRSAAGQLLAAQLVEKYRYENCAVVALSEGGVLVGEQIAAEDALGEPHGYDEAIWDREHDTPETRNQSRQAWFG